MSKKIEVRINPNSYFVVSIQSKFWDWLFHRIYQIEVNDMRTEHNNLTVELEKEL